MITRQQINHIFASLISVPNMFYNFFFDRVILNISNISSIFVNNSLNGTKIGQVGCADSVMFLLCRINLVTLCSWSDISKFGCTSGIQLSLQSRGKPECYWFPVVAEEDDSEFIFRSVISVVQEF
jgi:hypothetical protein